MSVEEKLRSFINDPDAPCRFPDRARKSMEACGINVVKLAADCGIRYMNGENTVTYFSAVFW